MTINSPNSRNRLILIRIALNALGIPTTRALSLTLLPDTKVRRERLEPGAIVCRFAQSWLRIGTFDILHARGDRALIRQVATYIAEHVFGGWSSLPSNSFDPRSTSSTESSPRTSSTTDSAKELELNRFAHLYRHIVRLNALTVAKWQAYGFMNGVLNTDNTSIMGLSLDFGPFAFMDNFDPNYTPNHDDHMLRYSYRNQPSIIWWNLTRLGESLGELIGAGFRVDDEEFIKKGVSESRATELIHRAESIIQNTQAEYQATFLSEYKSLMTARLGLKTPKEYDFPTLFSDLLDTMETLDLDFNHFFRRLSALTLAGIATDDQRHTVAARFFHREGITALGQTDTSGRERVATWLASWRVRAVEDWGEGETSDKERERAMKSVNPHFVPRGWVLDEVIRMVERDGDRGVLGKIMRMVGEPFRDGWGGGEMDKEAERWCGDVPRGGRGLMCSCSS